MKTIITIQHPQSEHHVNGMVGSQTEWGLTPLGLMQAENIAKRLGEELKGKRVALYASDQVRVKQGSELLANKLNIFSHYDTRLREQHLGEALGKSVEWLNNHLQDSKITADSRLVKGAESLREVWFRAQSFYNEIIQTKEDILVVYSHGVFLSVFYLVHLKLSQNSLNTTLIHGSAGCVSKMRVLDDGRHTLDQFNNVSYIKN